MARVTVEDCIEVIPNRFELVVVAAQRAKQIASGAPLTIERDNDKDAVVSLREVAEKSVHQDELIEEAIVAYTTRQMPETYEEEAYGDEQNDTAITANVEEIFNDVAQSDDEKASEAEGHMSFEDVDTDD